MNNNEPITTNEEPIIPTATARSQTRQITESWIVMYIFGVVSAVTLVEIYVRTGAWLTAAIAFLLLRGVLTNYALYKLRLQFITNFMAMKHALGVLGRASMLSIDQIDNIKSFLSRLAKPADNKKEIVH